MIRPIKTFSIEFQPRLYKLLIFNNKVREQCKSCKRYTKKATCPPYIETIDYYKKLLIRYKHGQLIVYQYALDSDMDIQKLGEVSTNAINSEVIALRNELIQKGHYFIIGFGAGSCKRCSTCKFPCRHPEKSLIPFEGTGLNVIETVKKIADIELKFPVKNTFYRVGCLFYD